MRDSSVSARLQRAAFRSAAPLPRSAPLTAQQSAVSARQGEQIAGRRVAKTSEGELLLQVQRVRWSAESDCAWGSTKGDATVDARGAGSELGPACGGCSTTNDEDWEV